MHENLIGGQLIYPFVDENWQEIPGRRAALRKKLNKINADVPNSLYISIELGGLIVFAGTNNSLDSLEKTLSVEQGRYPIHSSHIGGRLCDFIVFINGMAFAILGLFGLFPLTVDLFDACGLA